MHEAQRRIRQLEAEEVRTTQIFWRTGDADHAQDLHETRRELAEAREAAAAVEVEFRVAQAAATTLAARCPRGVRLRP